MQWTQSLDVWAVDLRKFLSRVVKNEALSGVRLTSVTNNCIVGAEQVFSKKAVIAFEAASFEVHPLRLMLQNVLKNGGDVMNSMDLQLLCNF